MTDREILELAAKSIQLEVRWHDSGYYGPTMEVMESDAGGPPWNPLTDDGDALRLAVKLHIGTDCYMDPALTEFCCAWINHREVSNFYRSYEAYGDNPLAATRRAIVRAAAELGKSM